MINTFLLRCMHCKEPETNLVYFDMHKVWILRVNVWNYGFQIGFPRLGTSALFVLLQLCH